LRADRSLLRKRCFLLRIEKPEIQPKGESVEQGLDRLERYLYRLVSELEMELEALEEGN